jgi:hypothetical protein
LADAAEQHLSILNNFAKRLTLPVVVGKILLASIYCMLLIEAGYFG